MAPAGTPKEVLAKIEADLQRVMAMPDVQQRFVNGGMEIFVTSAAEMGRLLRRDADQIKKIVDFAGIKPE